MTKPLSDEEQERMFGQKYIRYRARKIREKWSTVQERFRRGMFVIRKNDDGTRWEVPTIDTPIEYKRMRDIQNFSLDE